MKKMLLAVVALIMLSLVPNAGANMNRGSFSGSCNSAGANSLAGVALPACTVTVTNANTGVAAVLFSDNTGAGGLGTSLANPFTLAAGVSAFNFFTDDGTYNIAMSGTYTGAGGTVTYSPLTGGIIIAGQNSTAVTDAFFFVPETACAGATTGTVGAGNATDILAGSGGARVFRVAATGASSSANTFTCTFTVPSRLTAGKGATIKDITAVVSTQTTQPTSVTLATVKTFTAPAAVDPETANSATFVTAGGTITQAPSSAQFAAYAPVAAGQFFSVKSTLGTPVLVNSDLQTFQFVIVFNQSASAISIQELAGLYVHINNAVL